MNILHVLTTNKFGGAEKVAIQIIHATEESNNVWYLSKKGVIEKILNKNSVNSIFVKKLTLLTLKKICKEKNIELVHAHDFRASVLCSFLKSQKIVSHIHQSPSWINNRNNPYYQLYSLRMNRFHTIFVTSEDIINSTLFKGKPNVVLLPNYVSVSFEKKADEKEYDFLYLGRMEREKNPFGFLDFIEKFQKRNIKIKAVMVGTGSLKNDIEKRINEKKLEILMTGFLDNPTEMILKSKFLVSTSSREGFGLALVEAMQLGVPVISFRSGGVTDLIKNMNNGLIMSHSSIDNTIDNIINLLNDEETYNKLSENSRNLGLSFSMFDQWRSIILKGYRND